VFSKIAVSQALAIPEKFSLREISVASLSFIPLPHWHNQE
jgi:hypothetical protein